VNPGVLADVPPQFREYGVVILVAGAAVFLLALLLRSVRESLDALPHGESLDPRDLAETGLTPEIATLLREEGGEPGIFEGTQKRTGLAVLPDGGVAYALWKRLRDRLEGRATAFLPDDNLAGGVPATVVVIAARESLSALEFMGTERGREIEERVRAWRRTTPMELAGCGENWVELWLPEPGKDPSIFADAAAFCPAAAAVCGGAAGLRERADRDGLLYLFWSDPDVPRPARPAASTRIFRR
jgi:hypothetical protein